METRIRFHTPQRHATPFALERIVKSILFAALFFLGLSFIPTAFAVSKTWTGSSNSAYTSGGNWNPLGIPDTGDSIVVDNIGTSGINYTGATSALSFSFERTSGDFFFYDGWQQPLHLWVRLAHDEQRRVGTYFHKRLVRRISL